jgi:regulator of ribosome biosynthesis
MLSRIVEFRQSYFIVCVWYFRSNPEEYLRTLARDNTQLLLNEVWKLPFERIDDIVIAKLPKPSYILPREKPAPKPKTLTKWESYAKEKGITKRTKAKLVWDELVKVFIVGRRRYRYN